MQSTLQKLSWAQRFTAHHLLMKKYDLIYVFCCTLVKQQDFPVAVECVLIVKCFCVVQTWQARRVWKVIYSFQKSQNKTWMTVFLEEKKFVVFI